jgi:hypothetical protein
VINYSSDKIQELVTIPLFVTVDKNILSFVYNHINTTNTFRIPLELFCAPAYIPDRPVLVIITPTNVNEIRRTEAFVSDLFLRITCNLARIENKYIIIIIIIIIIDHGLNSFVLNLLPAVLSYY